MISKYREVGNSSGTDVFLLSNNKRNYLSNTLKAAHLAANSNVWGWHLRAHFCVEPIIIQESTDKVPFNPDIRLSPDNFARFSALIETEAVPNEALRALFR